MSIKIPVTPLGIETAAFQLVAPNRSIPACSAKPQYGVIYYVTFKVLTKVSTKIIMFWDMTHFNTVH
jgi:hypothetical protein